MELIEFLKTENLAFKRKLQSKSEALHILHSQLQACQQELDSYKHPLKGILKKGNPLKNGLADHQSYTNGMIQDRSVENVGQTVGQVDGGYLAGSNGGVQASEDRLRVTQLETVNKKLSDENKLLQFDVEDLKQKLNDVNNDLLMLRKMSQMRQVQPLLEKTTTSPCSQHLEQLEQLNQKYFQLEQDLHILLDEKQDLVKQRDIYYDKMQRLNIQIRNLLNISNQNVDFDAIVMENKYLKQRLEDVLNEKKLWNKTVSKYKTMLNNCQNTGKVLSYDQIAKNINTNKYPDTGNLRQICITLLETLNEKNLLLQHQRKTNKVLASRVLELEKDTNTSKTCDVLLKGYSATACHRIEEADEDNGTEQEENTNGKENEKYRSCDVIKGDHLEKKLGIKLDSQNKIDEDEQNTLIETGLGEKDEHSSSLEIDKAEKLDRTVLGKNARLSTIDSDNSSKENIRHSSEDSTDENTRSNAVGNAKESIDRYDIEENLAKLPVHKDDLNICSNSSSEDENTGMVRNKTNHIATYKRISTQERLNEVTEHRLQTGIKVSNHNGSVKGHYDEMKHCQASGEDSGFEGTGDGDIENLPEELQRLVLEAMKDLENEDKKT